MVYRLTLTNYAKNCTKKDADSLQDTRKMKSSLKFLRQ